MNKMIDAFSSLKTFLDTIGKDNTQQEQLFLTAGIVELLRHTKNRTHVLAMAELLVDSADMPWNSIPFSVTKTLLSDKYRQMVLANGVPEKLVPQMLLLSLQIFLNCGDNLSEAELQDVVETVCATMTGANTDDTPAKKEPPPKKDRAPGVEVFSANLLRRGFEPKPLTAELAKQLGVRLVTYRAPLLGDKLSPTLRAIAFPMPGARHALLLETGEYVIVPDDSAHLEFTETPADFKAVSLPLLANVVVARDRLLALGVLSADAHALISSGCLGKITKMHFQGEVDGLETIKPLTDVFSGSRPSGMLRDASAAQNFVHEPVSDTDTFIVISAAVDATGPYCVSRLVQDQIGQHPGRVLIRHDTPRQITPQGVYLFPGVENFVSLTAIFNKP